MKEHWFTCPRCGRTFKTDYQIISCPGCGHRTGQQGERPKINPTDVKWDKVKESAEKLLWIYNDACFRPPEARQIDINMAVAELNKLAEALCVTRL